VESDSRCGYEAPELGSRRLALARIGHSPA
jgi:hypothetical protein